MNGRADPGADPIEDYLDRLLVELRGRARDVRRILAEAEDHLRDAAETGVAEGLPPPEAAARAVARFGSPRAVARRFEPRPLRSGHAGRAVRLVPVPVLGQLVLALTLLGGVGLVAIGASGLVAGAMGAAFGKEFVAGDAGGVTYTPERCAYFLEYDPAPTCQQAATAHHFEEVVAYRAAAGVLGVLALGAYAVARRWGRLSRFASAAGVLPDGFVATMGVAVFGVAAVALVGNSLGLMVIGGETAGAGQYLSGGVVALAVAAFFLARLHRALLQRSLAASDPGLEPSPGI